MPTINIPPIVRFVLYLIGALALLFVAYAVDKDWAGDAEVRLVTGVVALLQLLAAAKTNISDRPGFELQGTVTSETGETGDVTATVVPDETGGVDFGTALVIAVLVVIVLLVAGVIPVSR